MKKGEKKLASINFKSFIQDNSKYSKYSNSVGAKAVYDYLSKADTIVLMTQANGNGHSALQGVQVELENNFDTFIDFSFNDNNVKQCVGSMIKHILTPFGYKTKVSKPLPQGKYFSTAMSYELDNIQGK